MYPLRMMTQNKVDKLHTEATKAYEIVCRRFQRHVGRRMWCHWCVRVSIARVGGTCEMLAGENAVYMSPSRIPVTNLDFHSLARSQDVIV